MDEELDVIILEQQAQQKSAKDSLFGFSLPGRIIFTIYTFHGLFFIYNLVIQYIILIPSILYTVEMSNFLKIVLSILYFIFAISSSNILVIPTFEFLSFPFLLVRNPFSHFISFIYIHRGNEFDQKKIKDKDIIINIILIVFEIIYFTSLIFVYAFSIIKFKDVIKFIILIIIYLYYLTLVIMYFYTSLFLFIKNIKNIKNLNWKETLNYYFGDNIEIPKENLMSYLINPFRLKNYKNNQNKDNSYYFEDCAYDSGIIIKIVLIIFTIIASIFIFKKFLSFWLCCVYFLVFFILMTILSIVLNFPLCYRNRKTFGTFGCCCDFLCFKKSNNILISNVNYIYKPLHPLIISITRFISDIIILLVAIALLYIHFLNEDNNDINDNIFSNIYPTEKATDTKKMLLPNICYSSIHNIPLPLYLPFINDAYYYNNLINEKKGDKKHYYSSSFDIDNYKKLFYDDNYIIEVYGNLIKKSNTVKMVQYNISNKKNYVTILSIKGTSYNTDIYIDSQFYFSSILLNLLSTFSISTEKNSLSFKLIEYSLTIPYRIFFRYLIIDKYFSELQNAYIENERKFFKNVVIVGHSLGGGLAKLFGRIMGKQAISLSGPGINAFHSLWNYKGKSENFGISAIDLVPDKDLVPRVEVSGGTIYRIICKEGVLNCHSKDKSLCEVLIMCRNPNYYTYCRNVANLSDSKINEIIESSELNEL